MDRIRLGVDGLPLGTAAVAVVGQLVVARFEVADDRGRAVDLEQRVGLALDRTMALVGLAPAEVRLVCVDDDAVGERLAGLDEELRRRRIILRVFDPVGPAPASLPVVGRESVARARAAALY